MRVIGGKPGTKVYWMVTGERKDDVAEAIRTSEPVEQAKTAEEEIRSLIVSMMDADSSGMDRLLRELSESLPTILGDKEFRKRVGWEQFSILWPHAMGWGQGM